MDYLSTKKIYILSVPITDVFALDEEIFLLHSVKGMRMSIYISSHN